VTVKDDLHHLVDELDEAAADELLEYAQWLTADEDEPLTDEERARVEAGEAEIRRGEYVTLEEVKRRLEQ
jgi:predicted transcriptional regulator